MNYKFGKDLTKEAPRSPKIVLGSFVILARTIDKCRALLWGKLGEYEFDCELDNYLFSFKGISGNDFKNYVNEGHSDKEIVEWVKNTGILKTNKEISKWTQEQMNNNYSDDVEGKKWLRGKNKKLDIPLDGTLFDYLEVDDKVSFTSP